MVPIRTGDIARMVATLRIYQGRSKKRKEKGILKKKKEVVRFDSFTRMNEER